MWLRHLERKQKYLTKYRNNPYEKRNALFDMQTEKAAAQMNLDMICSLEFIWYKVILKAVNFMHCFYPKVDSVLSSAWSKW